MNILGVELRRSAALGAALITVLIGVGALYLAQDRWAGGWIDLAMTLREYLLLLWPLALAAGAWQGRREHRAKVGELFASTARPRAQRMLPILGAMALTLATAYLLVTAAGIAWLITTTQYVLLLDFVVVTAVGAFSLIGAAWLGLGIGRMLPSLVTAPALGVAGVLLIFFSIVRLPDWLAAAISPAHGTLKLHNYQTIDNRVSAALAISTAALAITGLLLFVAGNWRGRLTALLPVALGFTLAIAIVPRDEDVVNWPIDPVARELVCTEDTPTVCVSRVNAHTLETLTPLAREALTALAKLPDAPTAVHEDTNVYISDDVRPTPDGVTIIDIQLDKRGGLAYPGAVAARIVKRFGIAYDKNCRNGDEVTERAAAYWLLGREPQPEAEVTYDDPEIDAKAVTLWQELRSLPDEEALARVVAVRDALRACQDPTGLLSRSPR